MINKTKTKIPTTDAEHPYRKAAIEIIEAIIEPLRKAELKGEKYYTTEDAIVEILIREMKPLRKRKGVLKICHKKD